MQYTKREIYELSLSHLLLTREVTNVDTDTSNEVRVLNKHWKTAFNSTIADLDLDSLSTTIKLELIAEDDSGPFKFVYRYPQNCILLRSLS